MSHDGTGVHSHGDGDICSCFCFSLLSPPTAAEKGVALPAMICEFL